MPDTNMPAEHYEKVADLPSQSATAGNQQQPLIDQQEPELNSHQPQDDLPKPTGERPSIWTRIHESWITEFLALIVAAGAIAAIVILLSKHDRTERPSWNGVTINSVVSWLTTAAGICMAYVAGMVISQLKWVWFAQQARSIEDMRLFNGAGGVAGALELMVRLRVRHFAVITLLAIIIAVGLDPFSQNLIGFYDDDVVDVDQVAMVTRSRWYNTVGPPIRAGFDGTNPNLKVNVDSALSSLGQSTNASLPLFICNTGNCTYPPFATLAYRAVCTEVSDKIKVNSSEARTSKKNDFLREFYLGVVDDSKFKIEYYNATVGNPALMRARDGEGYMVYPNISSPSKSREVFQYLRMDIDPNFMYVSAVVNDTVAVVAQECIIMPCVRSIEASVRHGVYSETVLDTYTEVIDRFTKVNDTNNYGSILRPPWGPDKGIHPGDDNEFGVGLGVTASMSNENYPGTILTGYITTQDGGSGLVSSSDQLRYIWYADVSTLDTCPYTSRGKKDKFACAMQAVADAYTQTVRDSVYKTNGTASPEGFARGETLVSRTFIRVEWRWIALHITVWALTAIGWVGTVLISKNLGIPFWRNNPMPMIYMYSDAQAQGQSAARSGSSLGMDMENGGDDVMMRLINEEGNMRLVREP
ncbi:hypothetical protein V493_01335 [Pseudogymnoascus sp. VKM F-4281 (FW-2241)]|nr:hypothetical protein V493_01335 [Pseudogymnoascus sp. VKM F-4281 (FW-2241)]